MQFEGAIIKEQGQTFGVIIVKSHILISADKDSIAQAFSKHFHAISIVLMAQDSRGVPTYYGRKDIVDFLSGLHISQLPWKRYTLT